MPDSYTYQPYPKTLYHPIEGACVVADAAGHAAKGEGWAETPACAGGAPEPLVEAVEAPKAKRGRPRKTE